MVECIGGYFQFSVKADGLYFTVYPPKSGEQPGNSGRCIILSG